MININYSKIKKVVAKEVLILFSTIVICVLCKVVEYIITPVPISYVGYNGTDEKPKFDPNKSYEVVQPVEKLRPINSKKLPTPEELFDSANYEIVSTPYRQYVTEGVKNNFEKSDEEIEKEKELNKKYYEIKHTIRLYEKIFNIIIVCVFLLVYPIRGIYFSIRWSINTLKEN